MLEVLKFLLKYTIDFISMLFTIDLGFTNLGALMCIVYIFLPVILFIVNFIKKQLIDEFDDYYDDRYEKKPYIGRHEFTGRHSKEYFKRQKIKEKWERKK